MIDELLGNLTCFIFGGYSMFLWSVASEEIEEIRWRRQNGITRDYDYWDGTLREIDWMPGYWTMAGVFALKLFGIVSWSWSGTIIGGTLAGGWLAPLVSYLIIAWRHHREDRAAQARLVAWEREALAQQHAE